MSRKHKPNRKPSPWERIVTADENGAIIRLSRKEVHELAQDEAIQTRGQLMKAFRKAKVNPFVPK